MKREIILSSLEETKILANTLTPVFQENDGQPISIHLTGDLGTGKTTLVKEILNALGVAEFVNSPTFTLIESYEVNDRNIYHIDLYRVGNISELEAIGLEEYLKETNSINFIEWAEIGKDYIGEATLKINLQHYGENSRICNLRGQAVEKLKF